MLRKLHVYVEPLRKTWHMCVNNIKTDFEDMGCEDVDMDLWYVFVCMAMDISIFYNVMTCKLVHIYQGFG
jgi:hypothetical protein